MAQAPITTLSGLQGAQTYASYKPSEVDWLRDVPAHWQMRRLCTIASITTGDMDTVDKQDGGQYPLYVRSQTVERTNCWSFDGEAVLTAGDGAGVGNVFHYVNGKFGYHQRVYKFSDFRGVLARFFFLYLKATLRFEVMRGTAKATVDSLRLPMLRNFPISLPPYVEQSAIIRFLDDADERIQRYINAKQNLVALLEEQKQAIVRDVVTGRIDVRTGRPHTKYKKANPEWLGHVPTHWERVRLKSVIRPIDRRSTSGTETLLSLRRDHGVVDYADHFSHPPQGATLVGFKLVRAGELVVNRLQANNGLVFCSNLDGLVSPDYSVFQTKTALQMQYLSDLLRTEAYRTHFRQEARGLGTGTAGFLRLYDDAFLRTVVYLPPVMEQELILRILHSAGQKLETLTANVQKELALMKEFRMRLIADVVTGKIDVRDAICVLSKRERNGASGEAVDCGGKVTEALYRGSAAYNETNG